MWLVTIAADVMWSSFEVIEKEDLTVEDTAILVELVISGMAEVGIATGCT